jgi:tetratricopeptide (TPR) repeat protein
MIRSHHSFGKAGWIPVVAFFAAVCHAAPVVKSDFKTDAFLIEKNTMPKKIELVAATRTSIRYRIPGGSKDVLDFVLQDGASVFVSEPPDFMMAMDLYRARRYAEAKSRFAGLKERYRPIEGLEDSYSTLAAYFEMECLRKVGDLEGLAAALQKFSKGPLSRDYQTRQLELYVFWDAVRTKSWDRLEALAKERSNMRLPGDQRAQIAWCHGLALENLGRPAEALIAYNTAITADAGASDEITRQAALRILGIHHRDPDVKLAIQLRGKDSQTVSPKARAKVAEAEAVAKLFELSLGGGMALPTEFREFIKSKGGE